MAAALALVGSRLRRVRDDLGLTLTQVAGRTGISKSTLSRLETGQRRPSLELLLRRTVLPLTQPGGVQAWKIVVPASQSTPSPRAHDGFEWLYVLSGRMRLVHGDQDLLLGVGEAAEFDTRVPPWFGSTGDGPAEVLSIFGRPGERVHGRAAGTGGAEPQVVPHLA